MVKPVRPTSMDVGYADKTNPGGLFVEYVCGFMMTATKKEVVLIEKQKPEWQKDFLNGPGSKVEVGETPLDAMIREFEEETGVRHEHWVHYATLLGDKFTVHFFESFTERARDARTTESERVYLCEIKDLYELKCIPNVRWLVPLAADGHLVRPLTIKDPSLGGSARMPGYSGA